MSDSVFSKLLQLIFVIVSSFCAFTINVPVTSSVIVEEAYPIPIISVANTIRIGYVFFKYLGILVFCSI